MKRLATAALAVGLCFSAVAPVVMASESDQEVTVPNTNKKLTKLTVDDAVKHGMKNNSTLVLLKYQLDILINQGMQTENDLFSTEADLSRVRAERNKLREESKDLDEMIEGLPGQIAALEEDLKTAEEEFAALDEEDEEQREMLKAVIAELKEGIAKLKEQGGELKSGKEGIAQAIAGLNAQLEALEDAVDQLRLAVKKIEKNEIKLRYDQDETKVLMEIMMKSNFVQLYAQQEQQALMEKAFQVETADLNALKRRYELGLVSKREYEKEEREYAKQAKELDKSEREFQRNLAKMALDLDVEFSKRVKLEPIKVKVEKHEREKSIAELIENSYAMKKAEEDLAIAQIEFDHIEYSGTDYELNMAKLGIKVEQEKIDQLKIDLEKAIEDLYADVADAYEAVEEKYDDFEYSFVEDRDLKRQYELGLLSKHQYEQADMLIQQAQLEYKMAETSYYLYAEQIAALEKGVIQTSGGMGGQ